MKNDNKLSKEDFLYKLSQMDKDQINQYIREKGKPRKLINPVFFVNR